MYRPYLIYSSGKLPQPPQLTNSYWYIYIIHVSGFTGFSYVTPGSQLDNSDDKYDSTPQIHRSRKQDSYRTPRNMCPCQAHNRPLCMPEKPPKRWAGVSAPVLSPPHQLLHFIHIKQESGTPIQVCSLQDPNIYGLS